MADDSRPPVMRERKTVPDEDGYLRVGLIIGGKLKLIGVHRIMAWVFHGPPCDARQEARHLDDVKTNNVPSNIAWGTRKQNAGDMMMNKRHRAHTKPESYGPSPAISASNRAHFAAHPERRPVGSRNPFAKLDESAVALIKQELSTGSKQRVIAAKFNVSRSTVTLIANNKIWTHV
jgi:hypothetical protein